MHTGQKPALRLRGAACLSACPIPQADTAGGKTRRCPLRTLACVGKSTRGPCEGSSCASVGWAASTGWAGETRRPQAPQHLGQPQWNASCGHDSMPSVGSSQCLPWRQLLRGTWAIPQGPASQTLALHGVTQGRRSGPHSYPQGASRTSVSRSKAAPEGDTCVSAIALGKQRRKASATRSSRRPLVT